MPLCRGRFTTPARQEIVKGGDDLSAFADGRCHALDRAGADVADRKCSRKIGLESMTALANPRPDDEALLIEDDP